MFIITMDKNEGWNGWRQRFWLKMIETCGNLRTKLKILSEEICPESEDWRRIKRKRMSNVSDRIFVAVIINKYG